MTQKDGACRWLLESQTNYLLLLAQCQFPRQLRSRFDPIDAVQKTLLQAHQHLDQCWAETGPQFRAWLRVILTNVLTEEVRRIARGGQDVSLCEALEESSKGIEKFLAADDFTPSRRLMREEQIVQMTNALAVRPANQQQAIQLHHFDGHSLIDTGQRMDRSKEAVAGLLFRGLRSLRDALSEPQ